MAMSNAASPSRLGDLMRPETVSPTWPAGASSAAAGVAGSTSAASRPAQRRRDIAVRMSALAVVLDLGQRAGRAGRQQADLGVGGELVARVDDVEVAHGQLADPVQWRERALDRSQKH